MKNLSFDNQSQLQIYRAVQTLLFTKPSIKRVQELTPLLTSNISTFTAEHLMSFDSYVVLSFSIAICKLDRKDLQSLIDKQMDNFQIVLQNETCKLLLDVVNCQYEKFPQAIGSLVQFLKSNFYLQNYAKTVMNLFKAKVYDQYLKTYNSVLLDKVSSDFQIQTAALRKELEYFIFTE